MGCGNVKPLKTNHRKPILAMTPPESTILHFLYENQDQLTTSQDESQKSNRKEDPIFYIITCANKKGRMEVISHKTIPENCSTVQYGNNIFFSGGKVFSQSKKAFEFTSQTAQINFDNANNHIYVERNALPSPKQFHSKCVINNKWIISVGGDGKEGLLDSSEKYDVINDKWEAAPKLNEKKNFCSVCAYNYKYVYVFGGFNGKDQLASVEYYDSVEGTRWIPIKFTQKDVKKPAWTKRAWSASIQFSEKQLMIIGGDNGIEYLDDTILFDVESAEFEKMDSCLFEEEHFYKRSPVLFTAEDGNKEIMIIGGQKPNLNIFNFKTQKWDIIDQPKWQNQIQAE